LNISKVNLTEKTIVGICINTNNSKASTTIPLLWNEFFNNKIVSKIEHKKPDSLIYSVYSDYESDQNGNYTVTIGVEINRKDIKKYNPVIIKKGKYILFEKNGKLPDIVSDMWNDIWEYFKENKDLKRRYQSDFEVYENENNLKIYIGIK